MRNVLVVVAIQVLFLVTATPAPAQSADPAFLSDIVTLLKMKAPWTAEEIAAPAAKRFVDDLRQAHPDMPQRIVDITYEVLTSKFASTMPIFFERWAGVFAKHFTHEEVRAVAAFYASDVGKKLVALGDTLFDEVTQVVNDLANGFLPEFESDLKTRLKAEGLIK